MKIKTKIKIKIKIIIMRMRMRIRMRMRMRMSLSLSLSLPLLFSLSLTIIIKMFFSGQNVKMSYYLFNRQEILEKAKKRYSKEKAAECYLENKEVIKKGKKSL